MRRDAWRRSRSRFSTATALCSCACLSVRGLWLPKWRNLLRIYRQLEARGDIRGGRFVAGFSGEQFALPEAVAALRAIRRHTHAGREPRIGLGRRSAQSCRHSLHRGRSLPHSPAIAALDRDGIPIALLEGRVMRRLETLDHGSDAELRMALFGHAQPASHLRNVKRRHTGEGRLETASDRSRSERPTRRGHVSA